MKSKIMIFLVCAAFLAVSAGTVSAALVDSSHDMTAHEDFTGSAAKDGACSFCHVPHGAQGAKLFPAPIDDPATGSQWDGDTVAGICWACHNGTSTYLDARNVNPFQTASHARDGDALAQWGDISAGADIAAAYGFSAAQGLDGYIGCQSCHNPHENGSRPFLRNNGTMAGGAALVEGDFLTLCDDCHVARDDNDGGNAGGDARTNHPTSNVVLSDATADANVRTYAEGLLSVGPRGYGDLFNSTWSALDITLTSSVTSPVTNNADHWNLGGKFRNDGGTTPATITGTINCVTCHALHGNELFAATVTDGLGPAQVTAATFFGPAAATPYTALTVYDSDPTAAGASVICVNCHDITEDGNAGPGATGTFSHPYDYTFDGTGATGLDVVEVAGSKWGGATGTATQRIVCQSCHDMHFNTLSDLADVNEYALQRSYCDDCHAAGTGGAFLPGHHPADITVTDAMVRNTVATVAIGANMDWSGYVVVADAGRNAIMAAQDVVNPLGWTAAAGNYVFQTGVMTCSTCHGGANATAHNEATSWPGVTGIAADDSMCVDCHGTNPSQFTSHTVAGTGSHFLGEITTADYKWAYGNGTAVTPVAGGPIGPNDSADIGGDGALICTSCHIIRTESGSTAQFSDNGDLDAVNTNYDADERTNDNDDNEVSTLDAVGMLLTPAGNNVTDAVGTLNDYLCTACHGAAPAGQGGQTGATHPTAPTVDWGGADPVVTDAVYTNISASGNFVTVVGDNTGAKPATAGINCESCHRAHDADTDGITYILEVAGTGAAVIDEAPLCNACHAK